MWDWSEMLPDIIHMTSLKIDNPFDLIHFRSVCSWWRASSLPTFRQIPSLRCPLPPDVGGCGDDCHIDKNNSLAIPIGATGLIAVFRIKVKKVSALCSKAQRTKAETTNRLSLRKVKALTMLISLRFEDACTQGMEQFMVVGVMIT
ncbi:hypothetical protein F2Q69_00023775 [Brassica cretica]|uniref:F-box domain-containing protein n=1 Tax=Brassica cretica TaxID=69181 RepID=A0A8S9QCA9_BRACR|nr:hypothetical protein F2Q69_00023775 [Brassica cretica]